MIALSRLLPVIQLCALCYVVVAVIYTTNYIFVSPSRAFISFLLAHHRPLWSSFVGSGQAPNLVIQRASLYSGSDSWKPSNAVVSWNSSEFALQRGLGHTNSMFMNEDLFLSKAFANSMHPSKIIPFFYRASGTFDPEDITITTLITSNRFQVFSRLVERYQGPISVTIHVKNTTTHIHDLVNSLHDLYASSDSMLKYVDVHLVIDSFDRQFNTWRNVARFFARTDFVMMLDIDFSLCTDFRSAIRNSVKMLAKLRAGNVAFVIPAFEFVKYSEGIDQGTFPRNKQTLLDLVRARRIGMFHSSWGPGHGSTDYERFYTAMPGEMYKVTQYQSAYEPYVIFKKEGPPWCDERFVGYGGNKAACLFEMYLSGISYYVLADHFIIHQNHLYEETARKNERRYNRKVYSDFKEETCLRYLKSYRDRNLLNTTRGSNVREECKKFKAISKVYAQLLND